MATVVEKTTSNPSAAIASLGSVLPRVALTMAMIAAIAIVLIYADTAWSIVTIWVRSETFAHGFVVIPIALWLAWRKREEIAATPASPWFAGLVFVALSGALWATMSVGGALVGTQFALAFAIQAAIVTVVGLRLARVLAFPLLFLLFAVPAGEMLVPTLIDWTADFTIGALRLSGVPVYREANHFIIPSGKWSVVEACSGLRYLIASFVTGVLFAAIVYRSTGRRVAFIAASIIVPLIANWLRAYMIVMLGHLSGNTIAVGVDHLIYGWIFFGVVLVILFWVGSLWAERDEPAAHSITSSADKSAGVPTSRVAIAALLAVLVAAAWRPVPAMFDATSSADGASLAPLGAFGGWTPTATPPIAWRPNYKGMAAEINEGFTGVSGRAALYIAQYRAQTRGREMVTTANALVAVDDRVWRRDARAEVELDWNGKRITVDRSTVLGDGARITVYNLYWIDGYVTTSEVKAKLALLLARLRGHGDDSMLVVAYAPETPGSDAARDLLQAYSPLLETAFRRLVARTP